MIATASASLLIQENADPDVRRDLEAFFSRLVPDGVGRRLALGTWQGIYLWEHRVAPSSGRSSSTFIGDTAN